MGRWGTNDNFELVSLYFSLSLTVKCFVERCGAVVSGALWCSGKASDSRSRGTGFDPYYHQVLVSLSKKLYPHCLELVSIQEKRGSHGRLVLVN